MDLSDLVKQVLNKTEATNNPMDLQGAFRLLGLSKGIEQQQRWLT